MVRPKLVFIIMLICCTSSAYGQLSQQNFIEDLIYNKMYKNIAAYNINRQIINKRALTKTGFLHLEPFFEQFLPDKGEQLQLEILKLPWEYPVEGYNVYRIKLDGLAFLDTVTKKVKKYHVVDGDWLDQVGPDYLICVKGTDVKFISGRFFLTDIQDDFKLSVEDKNSYIKYLQYKLFENKIDSLVFDRQRGDRLFFSGFSNILKRKVYCSVDVLKPSTIYISDKRRDVK